MSEIPKHYQKFQKEFPRVAKAYEELSDAVHSAGSLDEKTRALIKLQYQPERDWKVLSTRTRAKP